MFRVNPSWGSLVAAAHDACTRSHTAYLHVCRDKRAGMLGSYLAAASTGTCQAVHLMPRGQTTANCWIAEHTLLARHRLALEA